MTRKVTKKKLIKILKGDKKKEQMEERYQSLAECIRSDQVPASAVSYTHLTLPTSYAV